MIARNAPKDLRSIRFICPLGVLSETDSPLPPETVRPRTDLSGVDPRSQGICGMLAPTGVGFAILSVNSLDHLP